jgi:ABC-type multidrug transport system fused ATPase/permease subunit
MTLLQTYWRYLSGARRQAVAAVVALTAATGAESVALLALVALMQKADPNRAGIGLLKSWPMAHLCATLLAAGLAAAVLRFMAANNRSAAIAFAEARQKSELVRRVCEVDWVTYVARSSTAASDSLFATSRTCALTAGNAVWLAGNLASLAVLVVAATAHSPRIGLAVLVVGTGASVFAPGRARDGKHASKLAVGHSNASTQTSVAVLKDLKYWRASGAIETVADLLDRAFMALSVQRVRNERSSARSQMIVEASAAVTVSATASAALFFQLVSWDDVVVFLGVMSRIIPKGAAAVSLGTSIANGMPWFAEWNRAMTALGAPPSRTNAGDRPLPDWRRLVFDEVSFAYEPGTPVLSGVSLEVNRGEIVVLSGPSGHGKTTLMDVLIGLLTPSAGRIALDDVDLASVDGRAWRASIGLVPQSPAIVGATLREAITWPEAGADDARILAALAAANLGAFVASAPLGLAHPMTDGLAVSGGERQRVSLARALYRRASLLILDEPTSAQDGDSRQRILECLQRLRGDVTMFVITHDPVVIELADVHVELRHGRVERVHRRRDVA